MKLVTHVENRAPHKHPGAQSLMLCEIQAWLRRSHNQQSVEVFQQCMPSFHRQDMRRPKQHQRMKLLQRQKPAEHHSCGREWRCPSHWLALHGSGKQRCDAYHQGSNRTHQSQCQTHRTLSLHSIDQHLFQNSHNAFLLAATNKMNVAAHQLRNGSAERRAIHTLARRAVVPCDPQADWWQPRGGWLRRIRPSASVLLKIGPRRQIRPSRNQHDIGAFALIPFVQITLLSWIRFRLHDFRVLACVGHNITPHTTISSKNACRQCTRLDIHDDNVCVMLLRALRRQKAPGPVHGTVITRAMILTARRSLRAPGRVHHSSPTGDFLTRPGP
mmetsp:Transcript_84915/g.227038  ORF Transcript_84915/g.227038 Transcript_84915/m.227038 type:complete len:329 (-) Transcript_84915:1880-2866(-)